MNHEKSLDKQRDELCWNADVLNAINDGDPLGEGSCGCTDEQHNDWCTRNLIGKDRRFVSDDALGEPIEERTAKTAGGAENTPGNIIPLTNKPAEEIAPGEEHRKAA